MTEFAAVDVLELILVRLDASDLIRFKRVSKLWQSLISTPRFIKSHLEYTHKSFDRNTGHRRIHAPTLIVKAPWICCKVLYNIVGSYNGLVCVSSRDVEFVVTNPLTRQKRKLKTLPYRPHMHAILCWGFGYDSGADDYKLIAGFRKSQATNRTSFYVLTLKSNTWKFIRQVNYSSVQNKRGISCTGGVQGKSGVLYGGALHWYLKDENNKLVIVSFHLTTGEFKENPAPDTYTLIYDGYHFKLGVIEEEYLCMYSSVFVSPKKCVMKNNKWELLTNINDRWHDKFVVAHRLTTSNNVFALDDGVQVPANGVYLSASIFVKSLVSPHPHINNNIYEGPKRIAKKEAQGDNESVERGAEGNIRKRKWNMRK